MLYLELKLLIAQQAVHRPLPYMGKETITKEADGSMGRDGAEVPTMVPYTISGPPQMAAYEQAGSM